MGSTGGIFTILSNDGKQDRMVQATELLRMRLERISQARRERGLDPTPTLVDIEKTHILFMNAHFKPYAAIGYEYNKVRVQSGTVSLNSTILFSIPQFGDFFHDMVLHIRLGQVSASNANHTWRWCAFPGERLIEKVKFNVNGNPLDEYYTQDYNFYRKFQLPPNKREGWWRCMGQQLQHAAQVVPSAPSVGSLAVGDPTGTNTTPGFGTGMGNAVDDSVGFWMNVTDGYQTVKTGTAHAATTAGSGHVRTDVLEVTVPLLFWFNLDPRLAIPSVSIPHGQRYMEFDLTQLSNLCQGVSVAGGNGTSATTAATLSIASTEVPLCTLYVNNIFVNPEIHDIYIKRIGFNLVRVHRRQLNRIVDATNGELLLNSIKWPVEHIYFGFRPATQSVASASLKYLDGWHMFAEAVPVSAGISVVGGGTYVTNPLTVQYTKYLPLVNQVSFTAHGISIYNEIPANFFNQYIPFAYGDRVNTPDDPGAYMVTFNLYPHEYQPSGHINFSRAREFYVKFDDTVSGAVRNLGTPVDSTNTADFMGSACALNFLLVSDGSAILRYTT